MSVFLLTYDARKSSVQPILLDELRRANDWVQLSQSCYAISTSEAVEEIYSRFARALNGDDKFYVVSLQRPFEGQGPMALNDWLSTHLT